MCNQHGKIRPTDFTENYNTVAVITDVDFFRLSFLPVAVITCCRFYRCLFYMLPFFYVNRLSYIGRTLNVNNTLYKFVPRRKANWLALLTPQGYAKCQMLIFHHSSKTNELRNVQGSIKTASVSTFLYWPSLINYRYSVWSLW